MLKWLANTIDGFWSLIKRGIIGAYHKFSRKYLHLYVAEIQFRYNNLENDDIFSTASRDARHIALVPTTRLSYIISQPLNTGSYHQKTPSLHKSPRQEHRNTKGVYPLLKVA